MPRFRVVGIDKFNPPGEDHWDVGEYASLKEAFDVALENTLSASGYASDPAVSEVYYVYDENGDYVPGIAFPGYLQVFFFNDEGKVAKAENATTLSITGYDDRNHLAFQKTFISRSDSSKSRIMDFFSETREIVPPDQATKIRKTEYDENGEKVGEEWFDFKLSYAETESDSGIYALSSSKFDKYSKLDSSNPGSFGRIKFHGLEKSIYTYTPDKASGLTHSKYDMAGNLVFQREYLTHKLY